MKTLIALSLFTATLAWQGEAQNCFGLKPLELPPLGHPNATQQCVCESTDRCHWAWVDKADNTAQDTNSSHPYVNQFDQALRDRIAAQRREKELHERQQFIEQQQRESNDRQDARVKAQSDQANDLEILKAVHEGILVLVTPEDPAICNLQLTATQRDQCRAKLAAEFAANGPTIKNSSGQVFRGVAPASDHPALPTKPTDNDQYFTQGLLNGRMWLAMSDPDRAFYVAAYLQGYMVSCLSVTDDADQQKACYAKLGDTAHANPVNPQEIVDGVDKIFVAQENQSLIIPVAIKAASMRASGEPQDGVDKFLQAERNAIAVAAK